MSHFPQLHDVFESHPHRVDPPFLIAESFPLREYISSHLTICLSMDMFWSFLSTCTFVFHCRVNLCNYCVGSLESKQKKAERKTQSYLLISGKHC